VIQRQQALAPYLANPKLWHGARRSIAMGLAVTASFATIAGYLLISQACNWRVATKRRGAWT
jgi:uncharacterized protein (DUF2062 family)